MCSSHRAKACSQSASVGKRLARSQQSAGLTRFRGGRVLFFGEPFFDAIRRFFVVGMRKYYPIIHAGKASSSWRCGGRPRRELRDAPKWPEHARGSVKKINMTIDPLAGIVAEQLQILGFPQVMSADDRCIVRPGNI